MRILQYPALRRALKELRAERQRYADLERKFWALHERFDYRMDVMANNVILARSQNPPAIRDVKSPEEKSKPPKIPVMTPAQAVEWDTTVLAYMDDGKAMSEAEQLTRINMGLASDVRRYASTE